jgi:hypothetical protein
MGGRITVESVAGCSWNRWPDGRGIRTDHAYLDVVGEISGCFTVASEDAGAGTFPGIEVV